MTRMTGPDCAVIMWKLINIHSYIHIYIQVQYRVYSIPRVIPHTIFPKIPKTSLTPRLYSELLCAIYPLPSFASRIFMQSGTVSLYFGFSKNDLVS